MMRSCQFWCAAKEAATYLLTVCLMQSSHMALEMDRVGQESAVAVGDILKNLRMEPMSPNIGDEAATLRLSVAVGALGCAIESLDHAATMPYGVCAPSADIAPWRGAEVVTTGSPGTFFALIAERTACRCSAWRTKVRSPQR